MVNGLKVKIGPQFYLYEEGGISKLFIFDMDGLLLETGRLAYRAYVKSAQKYDYEMRKEVYYLLTGQTEMAIREQMGILYGEDVPYIKWREAINQYKEKIVKEDKRVYTKKGAEEILAFAKERGMGLDFNPTFFSHPMVKDGLTLSSPDEEVRNFWIEHGKACIRISQYFAEQTGVPCVMNIWTGDGFKDIPADRMGPRVRYKESIDAILSEPFDTNLVKPCVESKVFGIGVEAYTVGSAEFSLSYAAMNKDKCLPLMDNGHYHPTEVVSDKIPALLTFFPEIALHVTRPIRWDSDHVVLFDDETKEIAKEIVRCENGIDRTYIALDYFDASINRISAWVTGFRSFQKALLDALCQPSEMLKELQDTNQMSKKMVVMEQCKTLPIGDVWEEYCRQCGVEAEGWFDEIQKYEDEVLSKRA